MPDRATWPSVLLLLSGADAADLARRAAAVAHDAGRGVPLVETAATLAARRAGPCRLAVVAADAPDAVRKLEAAAARLTAGAPDAYRTRDGVCFARHAVRPGKVAFLFPGFGSAYPGMFASAVRLLPGFGWWFDLLDAHLPSAPGRPPSRFVRPEATALPPADRDGLEEAGTVGALALVDLLRALGLACDATAGHSNGENAALTAAGAFRFDDRPALLASLARVARHHATAADVVPRGSFLAVSGVDPAVLRADVVDAVDGVAVTMDNCPHQVVLFGEADALAEARRRVVRAGGIGLPLPDGPAYHTPLYAPQAAALAAVYDTFALGGGAVPVYSCATAAPFPDDPTALRALALRQWTHPVRFRETVEAMYRDGFRVFVEAGPNDTLTGFVEDTLRGRGVVAVACDSARVDGLTQLHRALGRLFASGCDLDLSALYGRPEAARPVLEPAAGDPLRARLLRAHEALQRECAESQARVAAIVALPASPMPAPRRGLLRGATVRGATVRGAKVRGVEALEATCVFDAACDAYLTDHRLGRAASHARAAQPLPVVPFVVSAEVVAAAARALGRGHVAALEDLHGHRWLALDNGRLDVRVCADVVQRAGDACAVRVRLYEADPPAETPAFEGVVRLGPGYPAAPAPLPRVPGAAAAWTAADFYARYAFHGPRFQSIRRLEAFHDDGFEAVVEVPAGAGDPAFELAPGLLDSAGQLVACWLLARGAADFAVFPFHVAAIRRFGPAPAAGTVCRCRGVVRRVLGTVVEATVDYLDAAGRLLVRVEGLRQRHYRSPHVARLLRPRTADTFFTVPAGASHTRRTDLPPGLLDESGGIWGRALAHLVLTPAERAAWYRLPPPDRADALLAHLAAKDAARAFAAETSGRLLWPDEVEAAPGAGGLWGVRAPARHTVLAHVAVQTGRGFAEAAVQPAAVQPAAVLPAGAFSALAS